MRVQMDRGTRIAVLGAGLAGLTAAGLLQRAGFSVAVYEQSPSFSRIGAGIILGANVSKVLRRLDLEDAFASTGIRPDAFLSRAWDSGEQLYKLDFDAECEARFGGPFVNIHRADLHHFDSRMARAPTPISPSAPMVSAPSHANSSLVRKSRASSGVLHRARCFRPAASRVSLSTTAPNGGRPIATRWLTT
jgi:hypothetical protein